MGNQPAMDEVRTKMDVLAYMKALHVELTRGQHQFYTLVDWGLNIESDRAAQFNKYQRTLYSDESVDEFKRCLRIYFRHVAIICLEGWIQKDALADLAYVEAIFELIGAAEA